MSQMLLTIDVYGRVCAEFIGDLDGKMSGLSLFSIVKIIFYDA